MKKAYEKRRALVEKILTERPMCEACKKVYRKTKGEHGSPVPDYSSDVHERATRARSPGIETILDEENCVSICRPCHNWVHDHPKEAEEIGLLTPSHEIQLTKIFKRRLS